MDAFSSNCKSYAGRWLAHNKLSLPARAYAAADLVNGVCQLVNPT